MFCSEIVDKIFDDACERAKRPDPEENNAETGKNTSSIPTQQVGGSLMSLLTSGRPASEADFKSSIGKEKKVKNLMTNKLFSGYSFFK